MPLATEAFTCVKPLISSLPNFLNMLCYEVTFYYQRDLEYRRKACCTGSEAQGTLQQFGDQVYRVELGVRHLLLYQNALQLPRAFFLVPLAQSHVAEPA